MRLEKWNKWLSKNFDFVFGAILFITYRHLINSFIWSKRTIPPEPDDSYFYLFNAKKVISPENFEQFRLILFSIWLNTIGILFNVNLEQAFKINFLIGPLIIFLAIYFFLSKIEKSKIKRLVLIVFLALYSGTGSYHGFYWVVPSFYQLALFFILAGLLMSSKKESLLQIYLTTFFFIIIHPSSILICVTFIIYALLLFIFKREIFNFKFHRFLCFFISIIFSYTLYYSVGRLFPEGGSPESFQNNFNLIIGFLRGKLTPVSFPIIYKEYFSILFFHPFSFFLYFLTLLILFITKNKIFILFISSLLLVFISSFIPYGERTLGFLWPLTFLSIGYTLIATFRAFNTYLPLLKFSVIPISMLFLILITSFNLASAKSINQRHNYDWDRTCPKKISENQSIFLSRESIHAFSLYGFQYKNAYFITTDSNLSPVKKGTFIVTPSELKPYNENLTGLEKLLTQAVTRRSPIPQRPKVEISWTQSPITLSRLQSILREKDLKLVKFLDCGYFQISKIDQG